MHILTVGTWRDDEALEYRREADEIGRILAVRGHTLIAAPSSGIQGLIASAYKRYRGREFVGYYASEAHMERMGETVTVAPDRIIRTGQDYPMRNLMQVQEMTEGIIAIMGGFNTVWEMKPATKDYGIPVTFFGGSSPEIAEYLKIDKYFRSKVFVSQDIGQMIYFLENENIKK